jgi:hypothetical protein
MDTRIVINPLNKAFAVASPEILNSDYAEFMIKQIRDFILPALLISVF